MNEDDRSAKVNFLSSQNVSCWNANSAEKSAEKVHLFEV